MEPERDLRFPPHRVDVARWVVGAEKSMITQILQNAWNQKGLQYFPASGVAMDDRVVVAAAPMDNGVVAVVAMDNDGVVAATAATTTAMDDGRVGAAAKTTAMAMDDGVRQ